MEPLHALGAMSGTSLDGVDAALVVTDGERIHDFGRSAYLAYTVQQRAVLRAALGQWQNGPDVAEAAEVVETVHARVLSRFPEAGLIGFHGQTFAHDPENRRTHQAGDGAMLAEVLGKPVIWDIRTMDVTLGGEGAPLAPAYHFACAQWMGATEPVGFLNLGGVGNLTWVNPVAPDMSDKGALLAFDTGPANAPIDDLAQRHFGHAFDKDGALADAGRVATGLV
ncbi:MAG: anhydro-N-acetylmuramic acid kinase, partial [Pseudomonadota bacterium]